MTDYYVSSAAYAAIPQWAASHAYSVGDIIRPLTAPALGKAHTFRVTTAGTSTTEPTWPTANNSTVTAGCTFTNVTGQSAYGWSAAAGDLYSISQAPGWNRPVVGDRVFLSSDHSENLTNPLGYYFNNGAQAYGIIQVISVNRAGSVPPVAADITSGAAITSTETSSGTMILDPYCNMFWQGITFTLAGTGFSPNFQLQNSGSKAHYFKNCAFVTSYTVALSIGSTGGKAIFDNTTVTFGATSQYLGPRSAAPFDLTWINTPSAVQGSFIPTTLFNSAGGNQTCMVTCRGVDLSAVTGTLVGIASSYSSPFKVLFDSCKIAAAVTRLTAAGSASGAGDEVELVNCYDGSNTINERHTAAGDVTTDRSTTMTGGAQDDIGAYSLKLVSSSRSDFLTMSLDAFWLDVENTAVGSSKTATVEIASAASLNNNDIRLLLEYQGTSGSPVASFGDSLASPLTATAALPSSSATWAGSPASKQKLQVTFTPQASGRVRGLVRLGKTSTTVNINPQIAIA